MNNNKVQIKFDDLFIAVIEKKFKIHSSQKINIIPEAKNKLNNLLNELNQNKITKFLEYGHLSFLLCFISIFFFIIFGLLNINFLLLFPILMFLFGMILMPIWQILINRWIKRVQNIINLHRLKLSEFYEIDDDTTNEDFSYKAKQYRLIPKIEFGFDIIELDKEKWENDNVIIVDPENYYPEFEKDLDVPNEPFKIRGNKLESYSTNTLKEKLIL